MIAVNDTGYHLIASRENEQNTIVMIVNHLFLES